MTDPSRRVQVISGAAVLLVVLIFAFAFVELRESRSDLLQSVRQEAVALIDALNRGSESAIVSSNEMERMLHTHLHSVAGLVAHLEEHTRATPALLRTLAREQHVGYLALTDDGTRIACASDGSAPGALLARNVAGVLRNAGASGALTASSIEIGSAAPIEGGRVYFLCGAPRRTGRGAVLAGVDAQELLAFRRKIGVGKLIQDIGDNPDIAFVALQDEDGIVAASRGVSSLPAIDEDPFLAEAFHSREPRSRVIDTVSAPLLEVVRTLVLPDSTHVLSRVGLHLENVRRIQQRGMKRLILLAAALLAAMLAVLALVATRSRFTVLREKHARVQSTTDLVLDNMADAVIAIDASGVITVFNTTAARMFDTNPAQAVGRACREVCPDDPFLLVHSLERGAPVEFEERQYTKRSGETLTVAVSTSILRTADGATDLVIAIVRDLTEQVRIRAQLERSERLTAMGGLASGIAHEIRNPLNAIHMIVQRFRREFTPTEDVEEYRRLTETVRGEVQRVNTIITQFLEFARPPKPQMQPGDLVEVVRRSLDVVSGEAAGAGVIVTHELPDAAPCTLDPQRMTQALLNLYQNALHAMARGGTLHISLSTVSDAWELIVRDDGHGIPEDVLPRIFNLYFTTKARGSGLGLSIVHQIVSEHDGSIRCESSEGRGTRFIITLPAM